MPKLANNLAAKAAEAEAVSGGFEPLKPGKYLARLSNVEAKVSQNGNAYWNWEFSSLHTLDGEKKSGRQWYMTMVPQDKMPKGTADAEKWEKSQAMNLGRFRHIFEEVFGSTTDTDTDELIGDVVVLTIAVETIQGGAKAGQLTNRVRSVDPANDAQIELLDETATGF